MHRLARGLSHKLKKKQEETLSLSLSVSVTPSCKLIRDFPLSFFSFFFAKPRGILPREATNESFQAPPRTVIMGDPFLPSCLLLPLVRDITNIEICKVRCDRNCMQLQVPRSPWTCQSSDSSKMNRVRRRDGETARRKKGRTPRVVTHRARLNGQEGRGGGRGRIERAP